MNKHILIYATLIILITSIVLISGCTQPTNATNEKEIIKYNQLKPLGKFDRMDMYLVTFPDLNATCIYGVLDAGYSARTVMDCKWD